MFFGVGKFDLWLVFDQSKVKFVRSLFGDRSNRKFRFRCVKSHFCPKEFFRTTNFDCPKNSSVENRSSRLVFSRRSSNFLESDRPASIELTFGDWSREKPIECRLNETSRGFVGRDKVCRLGKVPSIFGPKEEILILKFYEENVEIGNSLVFVVFRCENLDTSSKCQARSSCSWCDGRCSSKKINRCRENLFDFRRVSVEFFTMDENWKKKVFLLVTPMLLVCLSIFVVVLAARRKVSPETIDATNFSFVSKRTEKRSKLFFCFS